MVSAFIDFFSSPQPSEQMRYCYHFGSVVVISIYVLLVFHILFYFFSLEIWTGLLMPLIFLIVWHFKNVLRNHMFIVNQRWSPQKEEKIHILPYWKNILNLFLYEIFQPFGNYVSCNGSCVSIKFIFFVLVENLRWPPKQYKVLR